MLDDSISFQLNRVSRKISQLLASCFEPYGITPEQWTVLQRLELNEGISQKELADRVEKDQTNVARILDQLERKGLVARQQNKDGKRSYLTFSTEKGNQLSRQLAPLEAQVISEVLEGLTASRIATFREVLAHIWRKACLRQQQENVSS